MTAREILRHVDHTLLKPEATWAQVKQLCDEAVECGVASVCINPCFVQQAAEYLAGRVPVCTVVGFPLGAAHSGVKAFEARTAIAQGAAEVDMVIAIGAARAGDREAVRRDIEAVRRASEGKVLKVILETCLLTEEEKRWLCVMVRDCGADYVKTSTGFSTGGATPEDVKLLAECAGDGLKVKASGGIRTREDMENYLMLGADRLGTSSAVKVLREEL